MEITEALETIINARYGREVRQAIHDGIKQAHVAGEGAVGVVNLDNVLKQFYEEFNGVMTEENQTWSVI